MSLKALSLMFLAFGTISLLVVMLALAMACDRERQKCASDQTDAH